MLRENLPCFSSCLWSFHWVPLKKILPLPSLPSSFRYLYILMKSSWAFSRQNSPSTLSHFCYEARSSPFMIFMALCWTVSSMSLSLLWVYPVRAQGLVYAQCDEVRSLTLKFIPWPGLLSWRVHHPCFSLLTCFLHPGICKGCTSYSLQVTWWNFFWTCCFISVEIVCNKHEMHLCIFPACDFHKNRINFLLQWNELIRGLEYRSTQLLIIVLFFCLGFLGFFPHTFISNWWIKFP